MSIKIKDKFCPLCNAPLMIKKETPIKYYSLDENNKLFRDDNNDCCIGLDTYCVAVCSNDSEHDYKRGDIASEIIKDIDNWVVEVERMIEILEPL